MNLSSNTPKIATMITVQTKASQGFIPSNNVNFKQRNALTMYMTPCAKFKIPMILKRKAKPNANKMYIEDNMIEFTPVVKIRDKDVTLIPLFN